jgi:multidrug efflux pump subunit AcrA (membrane-fusion protein)
MSAVKLRSWRWLWVTLLIAAVAGVAWVRLASKKARALSDPEEARRDGRPIPVRTETVEQGPIEQVIGATALTAPSLAVTVQMAPSRFVASTSPTSDVVLKSLHVHDGDFVKAGQLVAELDDLVFLNALKQQKAACDFAQASLERARVEVPTRQKMRELDLATAESNLSYRGQDLLNKRKALDMFTGLSTKSAASSLDLYTARSLFYDAQYNATAAEQNLQRAKISVKLGELRDKEGLAKAESDYETARVALLLAEHDTARLKLTSPMAGFVDFRGKDEPPIGSVVAVGQPLFFIIRIDPLFVRLDYPQDRIDDVAVGQEAEIILDAFPKEPFHGKVVRITAQANPQLRVVPVIVQMDNAQHRVKAGISGFVRVRLKKDALTVPQAAIMQSDTRAMVYVVQDGRAHMRQVRTGFVTDTGRVEVREGLKAGEEVVTFHGFYEHWGDLARKEAFLRDGDPVDTDWRRWARGN